MIDIQQSEVARIAEFVDDEFGSENGPGSEWLSAFIEKLIQFLIEMEA